MMSSAKKNELKPAASSHVIILAGGQGTRLRPYTTVFPKALAPLADMPVLEVLLRQLAYYGLRNVTLAVGHLAGLIQAYFGDGRQFGISIRYALENQPLGTAGPLRILPDLPEHFLVINADVVCNLNFAELLSIQAGSGAAGTIAVYHRQTPVDFGVLRMADMTDTPHHSTRIVQFEEKPRLYHWVSMGVYAFSRQVVSLIPPNCLFGFDDLMHAMLKSDMIVNGYPYKGYWLDIGRVEDYEQAVQDFQAHRGLLLPSGFTEPETAISPPASAVQPIPLLSHTIRKTS